MRSAHTRSSPSSPPSDYHAMSSNNDNNEGGEAEEKATTKQRRFLFGLILNRRFVEHASFPSGRGAHFETPPIKLDKRDALPDHQLKCQLTYFIVVIHSCYYKATIPQFNYYTNGLVISKSSSSRDTFSDEKRRKNSFLNHKNSTSSIPIPSQPYIKIQ